MTNQTPTTPKHSLKGYGNLLRIAGSTIRSNTSHAFEGEAGCFNLHLEIDGLSDERRTEILAALTKLTGGQAKPVGDGLLHLYGKIDGVSIATAASASVGQFSEMLRKADVNDAELAECPLVLYITPSSRKVPKNPRSLRGKTISKLAAISHGTNLAAAKMFDIDARQKEGDKTISVLVGIKGLNEQATSAIAETIDPSVSIDGGQTMIDATCELVGGPLGALLLTTTKMSNLLLKINPDARVALKAN